MRDRAGVTSVSAAAAAAATPLVRHEDVLTVLPGTLPVPELARRLADTQAAVIMKLGRTFPGVVEALRQSGRLAEARYVERASTGTEPVRPVTEVDPGVGAVLLDDHRARPRPAGRRGRPRSTPVRASNGSAHGPEPVEGPRLLVVGLGPGPDRWLTPEAADALADGRSCRRLRPLPRPGADRAGSDQARQRQHRRAGPRPARPRPGARPASGWPWSPAATPECSAWPRRCSRPPRTPRTPPVADQGAARTDRGPGRGGPGRRPAGRRLRRALAVRSAQALVGDRGPAARRRGGRPGAGDLQPGLPDPDPQVKQAKEILLEYRAAETPVVVGRAVGRDDESLIVTTLGDLDPDTIDMSCLLIIGSSRTHRHGGAVWTNRSRT